MLHVIFSDRDYKYGYEIVSNDLKNKIAHTYPEKVKKTHEILESYLSGERKDKGIIV